MNAMTNEWGPDRVEPQRRSEKKGRREIAQRAHNMLMVTTVAAPSAKGAFVIWYEFSCYPFCLVMFDSKLTPAISVDQILKWHLIVPNVFTPFIFIFFLPFLVIFSSLTYLFTQWLSPKVDLILCLFSDCFMNSRHFFTYLFWFAWTELWQEHFRMHKQVHFMIFHLTQETSSSSTQTRLTKVIDTWQKYLSFMQINGLIHMCINWEIYILLMVFSSNSTINVFFPSPFVETLKWIRLSIYMWPLSVQHKRKCAYSE